MQLVTNTLYTISSRLAGIAYKNTTMSLYAVYVPVTFHMKCHLHHICRNRNLLFGDKREMKISIKKK